MNWSIETREWRPELRIAVIALALIFPRLAINAVRQDGAKTIGIPEHMPTDFAPYL